MKPTASNDARMRRMSSELVVCRQVSAAEMILHELFLWTYRRIVTGIVIILIIRLRSMRNLNESL